MVKRRKVKVRKHPRRSYKRRDGTKVSKSKVKRHQRKIISLKKKAEIEKARAELEEEKARSRLARARAELEEERGEAQEADAMYKRAQAYATIKAEQRKRSGERFDKISKAMSALAKKQEEKKEGVWTIEDTKAKIKAEKEAKKEIIELKAKLQKGDIKKDTKPEAKATLYT